MSIVPWLRNLPFIPRISFTGRSAAYEEWSRTRLSEFRHSGLMLNAFVLFVAGVAYVQAVRQRGSRAPSCRPQWLGSMWC
jgi:hypothetical protein